MCNDKDEIKNFKKLMHKISKGDKNAFEIFYAEYSKIIKTTAWHICKNRESANEVINDVLLKVWKYSKNYKEIRNPKGWIYRITENTAKTHVAKIKEYDYFDEAAFACQQSKTMPPTEDDFLYLIRDLSDFEQQIIILKIVCDLTFENIAEELNKPLSSISSTYYRALEKLKKQIKIFD